MGDALRLGLFHGQSRAEDGQHCLGLWKHLGFTGSRLYPERSARCFRMRPAMPRPCNPPRLGTRSAFVHNQASRLAWVSMVRYWSHAQPEEILGVAGQKIHYRKARPKKENAAQRETRARIKVWGDLMDDVGRPPDGTQFVHVCDRGADGFEVYCHLVEQQADWVVRASSLHCVILTPNGEESRLSYKTGCRVTKRTLRKAAHLKPMVGLMSGGGGTAATT